MCLYSNWYKNIQVHVYIAIDGIWVNVCMICGICMHGMCEMMEHATSCIHEYIYRCTHLEDM